MVPNLSSCLGLTLSKLSIVPRGNILFFGTKKSLVPSMCIYPWSTKFHNSTRCNLNFEKSYIEYGDSINKEDKVLITENMIVTESFLSSDEETSLLSEVEPYMKRLRYEFDHWDNAIHGYRETERLQWNEANTKIIDRVREMAFPPGSPQLRHVHILDLSEEGFIKAHIDSEKFCGNTIAGLSLLTDCVMRLVHDKDKTKSVDVLLRRRSLYIMKGTVRYDFTHEILPNDQSLFRDSPVKKSRRISIICRNEPSYSST